MSGWWVSSRVCQHYRVEDAPEIVADEIAGMWFALALLPREWVPALCVFALFRLLDVAKPGPIGRLDRDFKGGFGVMADDVLAGLLAGGFTYAGMEVLGMVRRLL